jgi:hypothetical protein
LGVLAGACGCLAGLLGFAPFLLLGGRIQRLFAEKGRNALGLALLVPALSFVLMIAAMLVCRWAAPEYAMVFAIACIVVFLLSTVVYGVRLIRR